MKLPADHRARACAVCGRILEQNLNTNEYQHAIIDQPEDHPPVPVPYDEIPDQVLLRCDFCLAEDPHWTLVADETEMKVVNVRWDAEWAACDECAMLIGNGEWLQLRRRVIEIMQARHGWMSEELKTELRQLFFTLRRTMKSFTHD